LLKGNVHRMRQYHEFLFCHRFGEDYP
jgi:hypothetical protein